MVDTFWELLCIVYMLIDIIYYLHPLSVKFESCG